MTAAYVCFHYWYCFLQCIRSVKLKRKHFRKKGEKKTTVIMLQGRVAKADVTLLNAFLGPEEVFFVQSRGTKRSRTLETLNCAHM